MVATLLRPLTSGIQDERIQYSRHPNIRTFIKSFVRAGRMTTQWVRLDFNQHADFGRTATLDLVRKGHFITRLFLVASLPDIATAQVGLATPQFCYTNGVGHALIDTIDLTISGATVETLDSRLLEHLDEFHTPLEKVPAVNRLIGRLDAGFNVATGLGSTDPNPTVTVPLPFWFSRGDSGCALPIDAMGSDLIQLKVSFRAFDGLYYTDARAATPNMQIEGGALAPIRGATLTNGNTMPTEYHLGDTYVLAEYVYVDKPEANRFRLADLQIPVVQHYRLHPFDTQGMPNVNIPVRVPNPARALYIYPQRIEAPAYNAHFLATRDLADPNGQAPWWPDAVGLGSAVAPPIFRPAFSIKDSEPITALSFVYEGNYVRWATVSPQLFRSAIVGSFFTKTPWINRYLYALPFGQSQIITLPIGEANLDKLRRAELRLQMASARGQTTQVDRYMIYVYVENYNILRVYGGRGSMLFSY
jgi:hypothetical protein